MKTDQTEPSRAFTSQTSWKPRGSMLLLVPTVEPEKTEGGIYIPDAMRRKVQSGFIADKGPHTDGDLSIGDEVFFEQHQEYRLILDDIKEEAVLIADSHILLHRPYHANVMSQPSGEVIDAMQGAEPLSHFEKPSVPERLPKESDTQYDQRMRGYNTPHWKWDVDAQDFERSVLPR